MILGVIVVFVVRIVCGVTSGEIRLCVMMEGEWREKKKEKKIEICQKISSIVEDQVL